MPDDLSDGKRRSLLGMSLILVIALGLGSRKFGSYLPAFVADNAGDALWTVAVYLTLAIVFPKWTPVRLGVLALGVSVMVELSQLIDTPSLNALRATLPGKLLLGAGFLWVDLIRYGVGALGASGLDGFSGKIRKSNRR